MGSYLLLLSVLLSWNRFWRKRFSVLNLALCLPLQRRSEHHKYRSIINHLLLLIHVITVNVPRSGLIFSPERRVRRAHENRRNFTCLVLANLWTSENGIAAHSLRVKFLFQFCGELEEIIYFQSSRSKSIVSAFELWEEATDGSERDFF